ncbi:SDR family oxidoreductase [Anaerolineales bacterium HSG25]|nr:SDR family oxidoreductase [Anaerolineales bacterium HSG25]
MTEKVAIITAASQGMGAECARVLAARGYKLVLMSRSAEIQTVASSLSATAVQGDVTNLADLERLVNTAMEQYGRVDALVNNTGHPPKGDLLDLTDEDWHIGLDLVLLNTVRLARLVVPIMEQQGNGAIINISTFGAKEPSLSFPISSSLRASLSAFTRLFTERYAKTGIRMNSVLPGFIDSYTIDEATRTTIPMQRSGTVKEIAETVAFLLSDEASYITGQNLCVDGGLTRGL